MRIKQNYNYLCTSYCTEIEGYIKLINAIKMNDT